MKRAKGDVLLMALRAESRQAATGSPNGGRRMAAEANMAADIAERDMLDDEGEGPCSDCERARAEGYASCEDCADGPGDDEQLDRAYPWRKGFGGS